MKKIVVERGKSYFAVYLIYQMATTLRINKITILVHILFWLGYLALIAFIFSGREDMGWALKFGFIIILPQMIIAYINMELLIPNFLIAKKYWVYIGFVLLCFAGLYFYDEWVTSLNLYMQPQAFRGGPGIRFGKPFQPPHFNPRYHYMRLFFHFSQTIAIFFLSTAYKTARIALQREKEAALLKSENLQSELKFLKSQINPHFLFNALNNIYTLSMIKSEKTPEMILKLSDMLRYILYDCQEERVSLQKEIDYIRNYVDLQKLKDEQYDNIEVDISADGHLKVAPMLLIPFIENAFKHGNVLLSGDGWMKVYLSTSPGRLRFSVENSIPGREYTKDSAGGIGLENVKKRLDMLYKDAYELRMAQNDRVFRVDLNILL